MDFYWPQVQLCVEVDGSGHERMRTKRQDARRDARLRNRGIRVQRFTGDDVELRAPQVVSVIRELLG